MDAVGTRSSASGGLVACDVARLTGLRDYGWAAAKCAQGVQILNSSTMMLSPAQLVVQRLSGDAECSSRGSLVALSAAQLFDDQRALVVFDLLRQPVRQRARPLARHRGPASK